MFNNFNTFMNTVKSSPLVGKATQAMKTMPQKANNFSENLSKGFNKAKSFADTVGTYADTAANLSKKIPQATMEGLGAAKGVLTRPGQTAGGRKKITQKTKKSKKSQKSQKSQKTKKLQKSQKSKKH